MRVFFIIPFSFPLKQRIGMLHFLGLIFMNFSDHTIFILADLSILLKNQGVELLP